MTKFSTVGLSFLITTLAHAACVDLSGTFECGETLWSFTPTACESIAWDVHSPNGDYEDRHTEYATDGVRRKIADQSENGKRTESFLTLAYSRDQLLWKFDTEETRTCAGCDRTPSTSHDSYTFGLDARRNLAVHVETNGGRGADLTCYRQ